MRVIADMSKLIEKEIKQAECYVDNAMEIQAEYPDLANDYITLAQGNLDRIGNLHTRVVKLIDTERKLSGEPPELMLKVYEYLHKQHIEDVANVRRLISEMR